MVNNSDADVTVRRNTELNRYELTIDGQLASYADYVDDGSLVVLPHTVTLPEFRGRGLAARLVRATLDDLRRMARDVEPSCWFVAEFIDLHPEYAQMVPRR